MNEILTTFARNFSPDWVVSTLALSVVGWFVNCSTVIALLIAFVTTTVWARAIKAAAVALVAVVLLSSYLSRLGLIGWPTTQELPPKFEIIGARIVPPTD